MPNISFRSETRLAPHPKAVIGENLAYPQFTIIFAKQGEYELLSFLNLRQGDGSSWRYEAVAKILG